MLNVWETYWPAFREVESLNKRDYKAYYFVRYGRILMAKTMIFDHATTRKYRMEKFNGKKVMSHGAYRAKRKPNSPIIKKAEAVKAAANFGKSPEFKFAIYGIVAE